MNGALAILVQLAAAGGLLVAATAKAAAPERVAATLGALGLRPAAALHLALVGVETVAAVLLVVSPGAPMTRALVLALGLAFAGAGLIARRSGTAIACACFGGHHGHPLGLRQVVALPGWVAVALVAAASPLAGLDGVVALVAVAASVGVVLSVLVLRSAGSAGRPVPAVVPS